MIPVISSIPVVQLASGDRLSLQVYQFQGTIPGKKAYLQSNLHGALKDVTIARLIVGKRQCRVLIWGKINSEN